MSARLLTLLLLLAAPATPVPSGSVSGEAALLAAGAPRPDASRVVVWLEGARRTGDTPGEVRGQMKSDKKRFAPRVLVVPKSAAVDFPNVDPIGKMVRIEEERFPVKSRLHGGWKGLLFNTFFVGTFNALPRAWVRRFGWHLLAFCTK